MADHSYRQSFIVKPADHVQYGGGFSDAEGRGWFIHDYYRRSESDGPAHGDALTLASGHRAEQLVDRRYCDIEAAYVLFGDSPHSLLVEDTKPAEGRTVVEFAAEKKVGRRVEVVNKAEILENRGHAKALRGTWVWDEDLFPVDEDVA